MKTKGEIFDFKFRATDRSKLVGMVFRMYCKFVGSNVDGTRATEFLKSVSIMFNGQKEQQLELREFV